MYSAENAIIFFHTLKTTAYAGNDGHQPEDRPKRAAPYSARYLAQVITLISSVMFARKKAKVCGLSW